MSVLEVRPLSDMNALAALYRDPYISRIGHDDRPAHPISHPAVRYIGAHVDGELVGAFMLIESGFVEVDAHVLLARKALPHSRTLGRMVVSYIFDDVQIERITAYVLDGLNSVINYCKRLGFKYEGTRRNACRKAGSLFDIHIMGLTRNDWKESQWAS